MRAISLFSGAGGMDVGFATAGIEAVIACEMNADAAATYRANFAGSMHHGDVRDLIPDLEVGMADFLFGGPPCQGYSIAGKMDPNDERSMLVLAFLDAVDRSRPQAFVMENVDALATLDKWSGMLEAIREKARGIGYSIYVRVLNAADFGVPQNRRRMFMWGVKNGDELALRDRVEAVIEKARTKIRSTSRDVFLKLGPAGTAENPATCPARITFARNPVLRRSPFAGMLFNGAGRPVDPDAPAPTIAASTGGNKTHIVDEDEIFRGAESFVRAYHARVMSGGMADEGFAPVNLRRLTIEECRHFQTFPQAHIFLGSRSSIYRQIGNAVPCELARVVAEAAKSAVERKTLLAA